MSRGFPSGGPRGSSGGGAEQRMLRSVVAGAWPSLPALAVGTAAVCAAAGVVVALAPGADPLAPLLAAVLVAPCAAATADAVNRIAREEDGATIRQWASAAVRLAPFGMRSALPAGAGGAVLLLCLRIHRVTGSAWVLPSLVTACAVTGAGLLALPTVLALGAARPRLRGPALWVTALHLTARAPLRFLAGPALLGLGVWASAAWSASLLPLAVGPAALVCGAAVWTTAAQLVPEASTPAGVDGASPRG